MTFEPVRKLNVQRTFADGTSAMVGTLAQDKSGVYFAYHTDYIQQYSNLSPFTLDMHSALQAAPLTPHHGLHGVFADSLPDGWGLLLQDRFFRRQGLLPHQITAMDRLAFVGDRGIGALRYEPCIDGVDDGQAVDLAELGIQAQAVFDGQTDDVLQALLATGSSGGARPKAQLYMPADNPTQCRTRPQAGDEAWIVKFTSQHLPLAHEEGLCEAVYLTLAEKAGLAPVQWQLFDAPPQSGATHWLGVKRFDCTAHGRLHVHSAAGLLDADFRLPSLDYADLIKAGKLLCRTPEAGKILFARAMFNLFALNQDDHAKNFAFIQQDNGDWQPSPLYDVTFSPSHFGEHATAFGGYGQKPPLKTIQQLAKRAGFEHWAQAKAVIEAIASAMADFRQTAIDMGMKKSTVTLIEQHLNQVWRDNQTLLA